MMKIFSSVVLLAGTYPADAAEVQTGAKCAAVSAALAFSNCAESDYRATMVWFWQRPRPAQSSF
jgi:hypothetical protein